MIRVLWETPQALRLLLRHVRILGVREADGVRLYSVSYNGVPFTTAYTGIGKVAASRVLTLLDGLETPDGIIGISGVQTLDPETLPVGSVFFPDSAFQYDVDFTVLGAPGATLPDRPDGLFDTALPLRRRFTETVRDIDPVVFGGRLASGDGFIGDLQRAMHIRRYFDAIAADSFAGTVGQLAASAGIPFIHIGIVSSGADRASGASFAETYPRLLADLLERFLP